MVYAVFACQGSGGEIDVCSLQESSGAQNWCTKVNDAEDGVSSIMESDDTVYVSLVNALQTVALDATSGAIRWTANTSNWVDFTAAADGLVYLNEVRGSWWPSRPRRVRCAGRKAMAAE